MADVPTLKSVRMLVVGASAGIGRAVAAHAMAMGASVCVSARRAEKLDELCSDAGTGHALTADMAVSRDCRSVVLDAAEHLGGLDLVLYAAGAAALTPVVDASTEEWQRVFAVNTIGPSLVCAAAMEVLSEHGVVSFLSSEGASETRWGLSTYSASKSALDTAIRFWRHEHPERRFQRIIMGATAPTEFGNGFGPDLDTAMSRWAATGTSMSLMETDDVGRHLAEVMALTLAHPYIDVPDIVLDPRGEAWG